MDKIDFIFNDRWIKDKVRYWLNAAMPADEHRAVAFGLLEAVATQYAALTYFDGNDLYILAHADLDKCITVSRNSDLQNHASDMYWMGNGGLYVKSTPVEVKSAIERAMGRVSEDADNRAAKKSCSLH